jgi:hypothetical protein
MLPYLDGSHFMADAGRLKFIEADASKLSQRAA